MSLHLHRITREGRDGTRLWPQPHQVLSLQEKGGNLPMSYAHISLFIPQTQPFSLFFSVTLIGAEQGCPNLGIILISARRSCFPTAGKTQMHQPVPEIWHRSSWKSPVWAALRGSYGFQEGKVGMENPCRSEAGAYRRICQPISQPLVLPTSRKSHG